VEPMKDVVRRRDATGRGPTPFDPSLSEWGNPRAQPPGSLFGERARGGTETSQYLQHRNQPRFPE